MGPYLCLKYLSTNVVSQRWFELSSSCGGTVGSPPPPTSFSPFVPSSTRPCDSTQSDRVLVGTSAIRPPTSLQPSVTLGWLVSLVVVGGSGGGGSRRYRCLWIRNRFRFQFGLAENGSYPDKVPYFVSYLHYYRVDSFVPCGSFVLVKSDGGGCDDDGNPSQNKQKKR